MQCMNPSCDTIPGVPAVIMVPGTSPVVLWGLLHGNTVARASCGDTSVVERRRERAHNHIRGSRSVGCQHRSTTCRRVGPVSIPSSSIRFLPTEHPYNTTDHLFPSFPLLSLHRSVSTCPSFPAYSRTFSVCTSTTEAKRQAD